MKSPVSAPTSRLAPSVRSALRTGTAPLHAALDARIAAACLGRQVDPARLLAIHARALPPLVAGLSAAGAAALWPGWDEPARLAALADDLRRLVSIPSIAPPASPAGFEGPDAVWGGLYALLGSRLGNRVVLRRLAAAGRPVDSAFLRFGTEDTGAWPRFLHRLEQASVEATAAVAGAALVMRRYLDAAEPGAHTASDAAALI